MATSTAAFCWLHCATKLNMQYIQRSWIQLNAELHLLRCCCCFSGYNFKMAWIRSSHKEAAIKLMQPFESCNFYWHRSTNTHMCQYVCTSIASIRPLDTRLIDRRHCTAKWISLRLNSQIWWDFRYSNISAAGKITSFCFAGFDH